jgi:signal transduction histidine kinase
VIFLRVLVEVAMADELINCVSGFGQVGALSRMMNVGVLLLEPTGKLEFANPLACELLGFANEAQLKQDWPRVQPLLQLVDVLPHVTNPNKPRMLKANFPLPEGERQLRLEVNVLDQESCSGYLVLLRDRRSVQIQEADLLLASQMRAQNYLYGALVHDLRAPLNAMQITMELLSETVGGASHPNVTEELSPQRYVGVLREEMMRLNRLLGTVLDFGAPLNKDAKEFDVVAVVQELEMLLKPQARRQRVEMKVQLPSRFLAASGQRDSIKQALLNIVINALEAMPQGGTLTIAVAARDRTIEIQVNDTGPGVPEELMDSIYQVYFTTKKTGSGMGLHVARLVLEAHGGDIEVVNDATAGACFTICLPLIVKQ